jgi:purine nucleosidase
MNYPEPKLPVEKEHAVDAIIRIVEECEDEIEIITLGPLTNIAMAMAMAPETMKKVSRITAMGGAHMPCNAYTPAAEFNILVDPEAANLVFGFGIPILLAPFELCISPTALTEEEAKAIHDYGTPLSRFVIDCNRSLMDYMERAFGKRIISMPDPTAVAVALWPETIAKYTDTYAFVDTKGQYTYGQTVFDYTEVSMKPYNVRVVDAMDCELFKKIITNKFTANV